MKVEVCIHKTLMIEVFVKLKLFAIRIMLIVYGVFDNTIMATYSAASR